ncbi:MAG: hypothetical protein OEV60_12020, partial [Actinomycetota bacterium]|nr:hypothetical protein [Actinomycetota bacterium]
VALCDGLLEGGDRLLWAYGTANGYARAAAFRGDFDQARELLDRAAEAFAELGGARGWYSTAMIRADMERLAGHPSAAAEVVGEAVQRGDRSEPEALAWIADEIALQRALDGDGDDAERWLARARPTSDPDVLLMRKGVRIRILLAKGRLGEAVDASRAAVVVGRGSMALDYWATVLEGAADAFDATGSGHELRSTLDELADAYRRKGNLVALRRTEDRIAALGSP